MWKRLITLIIAISGTIRPRSFVRIRLVRMVVIALIAIVSRTTTSTTTLTLISVERTILMLLGRRRWRLLLRSVWLLNHRRCVQLR